MARKYLVHEGTASYMNGKEMKEKKAAMEQLAMDLIQYVEDHPDVYDWSQMPKGKKISYKSISAYAIKWACIREAKDYCNTIFEGRLVNLGMERSKMSDSFIKFMLSRRHGWVEKQEVEMKVEGNISFRDLVAGDEELREKDGEDESEEIQEELREEDADAQ